MCSTLSEYIINNFPPDIKIILVDAYDTLEISSYKCLLGHASPYFHKLWKYNTDPTIPVNVMNVKIAYDLIWKMCGKNINSTTYTETRYLLETTRCRRYWCLKNEAKLLYNIKINEDDFDLFLEILDEFDIENDPYLMNALKQNIPLDYDFSSKNTLSIDLLKELSLRTENYILSGSSDGSIGLCDAKTGKILDKSAGWHIVTSVSSVGNKIVFSNNGGKVFILAIENEKISLIKEFYCHEWIHNINISSDASRIVCSCSNTINIFDMLTGDLLSEWQSHSHHYIRKNGGSNHPIVRYSPNNLLIASGCQCNMIVNIWDASDGKLLHQLIHSNEVNDINFSPDGKHMVVANDIMITVWDCEKCEILRELSHGYIVNKAICSPNKLIASGGIYDKNTFTSYINLWDMDTGNLLKIFKGYIGGIIDMIFCQNGRQIISSDSTQIRVWDTTSGQLLQTIDAHRDTVKCLAYVEKAPSKIDKKLCAYLEKIVCVEDN